MRNLLAVAGLALAVAVACVPAAEPAAEKPIPLDEVLTLCAADLATVDGERARTTRYISLHEFATEKDRTFWVKVMSGHIHQLARSSGIYPPVRVGVLLRIDVHDYGESFERSWEKLGEQEPYWHGDDIQPTDGYEDVEYGFWVRPDGSKYTGPKEDPKHTWERTRIVREKTGKVAKTVHGLFVRTAEGKTAMEKLQTMTGGTDVPVVEAGWFFQQTAVQFKRSPGYYDFIGVKDLKDYEKLIGFNRDKTAVDPGFLEDIRAAVASSTVTGPDVVRRIVRFKALGGAYWFTQDSNLRQAKNREKANAVTNLGDDYEFQAIETIGYGPNGMPKTGLFNQDGVKQDIAPDFIASDSTAPFADRRVHVNMSCTRCHQDAYLQPVDDWIRNVQNALPNFLTTKDPDKLKALRQQYVHTHLDPHLKADRDRYAGVLFAVTGMKPTEYAAAYGKAWQESAEDPITVDVAARRIGCTTAALQKGLADQGARVDPTLSAYRLPRPRAIPATVWFDSVQRAVDASQGVSRPFKIREK